MRKRRGRTLRYGFSASLTEVDLAFSEPESGLSTLDFDKGIGFSFGTFGRLGFSRDRFGMQSELELEFKQASFRDSDCVNPCFAVDVEMLYVHLNLPRAMQLRVSGIDWSLQAGPSVGLLIASKAEWTLGYGQSGNLDLEPIEVGYVAGIEVAVTGRVHVGIRYHGGWTLSNNAVFQTNQRTTGIGAGMQF